MEQITLTFPCEAGRDVDWIRSLTPDETAQLLDALQALRAVNSGASAVAWQVRLELERERFKEELRNADARKKEIKECTVQALLEYASERGRMPRRRIRVDGLTEEQAKVVDADLWDASVTEAKRRRRTAGA